MASVCFGAICSSLAWPRMHGNRSHIIRRWYVILSVFLLGEFFPSSRTFPVNMIAFPQVATAIHVTFFDKLYSLFCWISGIRLRSIFPPLWGVRFPLLVSFCLLCLQVSALIPFPIPSRLPGDCDIFSFYLGVCDIFLLVDCDIGSSFRIFLPASVTSAGHYPTTVTTSATISATVTSALSLPRTDNGPPHACFAFRVCTHVLHGCCL